MKRIFICSYNENHKNIFLTKPIYSQTTPTEKSVKRKYVTLQLFAHFISYIHTGSYWQTLNLKMLII